MALKTGLVAVVIALEGICRTIRTYRTKMDVAIDAAVTGGVITVGQGTIAKDFLTAAQAACDVLRIVTGY